jgi:hypothetical protein
MRNVKVVEVDNETKEQSGESDSEDLDYNRNDDEVFDDDGQVIEDVPVSKSDLLCHNVKFNQVYLFLPNIMHCLESMPKSWLIKIQALLLGLMYR